MMCLFRAVSVALVVAAGARATAAQADTLASSLRPARLFSDGVVLQRGEPIPVWGWAPPKTSVSVLLRGQSRMATADAGGNWRVSFAAMNAGGPYEMTITGDGKRVVVRDVLVGDVWVASGQSNMEWPVSFLREDEKKIAAVDLPLVRQLKIERASASHPQDSAKTSGWETASPATVGNFSAVGYFFARELQRKLGVPVGIVNSSWGGTEIEAWMSAASRESASLGAAIEARWQKAMSEWPPERIARYPAEMAAWQKADAREKATHVKNTLPWPRPPATIDSAAMPGGLFNAMIAPLQPGAIRGIIWYQGESNVERPNEYAQLFPAMIRSWRANWGDDHLPFYFVQLPNYADGKPNARTWARLREAQEKALELPATAMAVAIDVGDAENLHPTAKMEIARRLALIAKAKIYGVSVDFSGPVFQGATREGPALRVRFTHTGAALVAQDRPVQSLEIAGADKVFFAANAKIDRDTLLVSSPKVKEPVAVRYAWSNAPLANLYNGAGLPAAPFRSDDW